ELSANQTQPLDVIQWNKEAGRNDILWAVHSIKGLRTAISRDGTEEVREVVVYGWQPAWIPVSMMSQSSRERFKEILDQGPTTKTLSPKELALLERILEVDFQYPPLIRRVCAVASANIQSKTILCAKVSFADTYEHCTNIGPQVSNYEDLYRSRIKHAEDKLKTGKLTVRDQELYDFYKLKSEERLADLEQYKKH